MSPFISSSEHPGNQYGRVHPLKIMLGGLLLLIMVIFGGGATHSLMNIRQHNDLLEQRAYEMPWSMMQLQLELGRFLDAVRLRHADAISQDDLMLRYDILWSRTPVLLNSQFKDSISARPDLWLLLQQIETRVQGLESSVMELQPGSPTYRFILAELSPYLEPLSSSVTATMHNNVHFYTQYDQVYRELGRQLYTRIIGFGITLLLLLLLLWRQLWQYRVQQLQDPLTGLPNRFVLQRHMAQMIEQGLPFSVTVLELKDFSQHQHRFGFEVADRLRQVFSHRLQQSLHPHEFIAQPGPQEIAVVARGVVELEEVRAQLSRFRQALLDKVSIDAYDFYMEPLIGVVLYPADADNLVDLLARGELALEQCKREQLPYVIFDPSLLKDMSRRQQLARDLPAALDSNSLSLQLQPLVDSQGGECHGLQVLLNWHHPGFGMIPAAELVRITEQYQLSERVFRWLLPQVLRPLSGWRQANGAPLFLSLTVSPSLFRHGLEHLIMPLLEQHDLQADALVLDVNETTAMRDVHESLSVMAGIRAAGIRILLSDFGSGGSAWGYLSRMPVSWLKLDPTFCNGIEREGEPRHQLDTLLALARVLQRPVVCCGVDHQGELDAIRIMNESLLVQGEAVGGTLSVQEVTDWLKRHRYQ
ncbi:bifunctional diguanylate cyclase/phosphodiesterase [Oceanisphaera psychrotolerans]|uniref:Diguanylate cyclase n=1 Tax=Oceanisphaera psychrotolerans TaxID=1414654 RepID=A0A1J4QIF5_9GAMM|nr:GGDEF domain-containing protein [Oceanisphaera psychrotolerans]OIN13535.1 diguanylate cyclase [Oceanisphaera psychrotolerans]